MYVNITNDDDNTTSSNNDTDTEPIPPCPLAFAVRSSGLAGFDDESSHVKNCSEVSTIPMKGKNYAFLLLSCAIATFYDWKSLWYGY